MNFEKKDRKVAIWQTFFPVLFMVYLQFRDSYKIGILQYLPILILVPIVIVALAVNVYATIYWKREKSRMIIPSIILLTSTMGLGYLILIG